VDPHETYASLYQKVLAATPEFVGEVASMLATGIPARCPQVDADATYFRNDREMHHRIFWDLYDAAEIDRIVRAGSHRAYFFWGSRRVQVAQVTVLEQCDQLTNALSVPAGVVVDLQPTGMVVSTQKGYVRIEHCVVDSRVEGRGAQVAECMRAHLGQRCG
jgi:methionyl-tRNA formyltransferase